MNMRPPTTVFENEEVDSEEQLGMLETIRSKCRCIGVEVDQYLVMPDTPNLLLTRLKRKSKTINLLAIADLNIKQRIHKDGNGYWFLPLETLEGIADAVAIFYKPSWTQGAIWEQSMGNTNKDDYRRLGLASEVTPHLGLPSYKSEIRRRFTELNLRKLIEGNL